MVFVYIYIVVNFLHYKLLSNVLVWINPINNLLSRWTFANHFSQSKFSDSCYHVQLLVKINNHIISKLHRYLRPPNMNIVNKWIVFLWNQLYYSWICIVLCMDIEKGPFLHNDLLFVCQITYFSRVDNIHYILFTLIKPEPKTSIM